MPVGTFEMSDRRASRQSHYVWMPAFFLAAFEVTNGEFRRFLRDPEGYLSSDDLGFRVAAVPRPDASAPARSAGRLSPR